MNNYFITPSSNICVKLYLECYSILLWVLVSLTGKIFDGWIKDLGFNFCLHHRLKLSLKKKKKKECYGIWILNN